MDIQYMELIKKSVSNAWKYKFLWLFGFFVSVSGGFGGGQMWTDALKHDGDSGSFTDFDGFNELCDLAGFQLEPFIILYIVLAAIIMALIFWVLSIIGEGALIHGISKKELNLEVNFTDCWSIGISKFFRIFGIMFLAGLFIFFSLLFLAMIIVPSFFASTGLGIILTVLALPVFIIIILLVICIEGWAIRYATMNDTPWLDSIGQGWRLFAGNIGKTLGVAFSSLISQIVMGLTIVFCMIFLAIPFVLLGIVNIWLGIIPGILTALFIIILFEAFLGTFASSVWTLGFMQLTGHTGQPAVATTGPPPPSPPSDPDENYSI